MQFIGRTVSRAIASIIQAAFLILLSRALGIKEFGTFSTAYSLLTLTAYSLLTLLAAALSFGVTAQALRAKADVSTSILKEKLTSLRFFGTIILVCISVGVMAVSDWSPALIGLAASLVLSDYWIDYAQAWLAGSDKQFASSSLILMQRIILILPVLVSFLLESSPDPSAELSSVLISLAAFIPISAAIIIVRAKLINPFTGNVRQLLSYWLAGLVGNLKQLEQPSVAYATSSMGLAAGYAMGVRITNPILIVPTAFQTVIMSKSLDPGLRTDEQHQLSIDAQPSQRLARSISPKHSKKDGTSLKLTTGTDRDRQFVTCSTQNLQARDSPDGLPTGPWLVGISVCSTPKPPI